MQARLNPPYAGRLWIREGWRLFRLQPVGFIILLFSYLFGMLALSLVLSLVARALSGLIPMISADTISDLGSLLAATLVPGLSVGFMEACRVAESKQPIHPRLLVKAFLGDPARARNLLVLGAVYSIAFAAILGALSSIDVPGLQAMTDSAQAGAQSGTPAGPQSGAQPGVQSGTPPGPQPAELPPGAASRLLLMIGAGLIAYIPVAMALWYSPVLVAWHRMPALKAMFYSFAACWRNRTAFMVYALVWGAFAFAIPALGVLLRAIGLGSASIIVMMPLMGLFMGWLYCSFYATYTGVWVAGEELTARDSAR